MCNSGNYKKCVGYAAFDFHNIVSKKKMHIENMGEDAFKQLMSLATLSNKILHHLVKNNPDMKDIISIAAYMGKEFKVSIISKCLEISRLAAIQKLDQIANNSGLFFDLLNKDDVYSFRSQAFLDATRLVIGYTDEGSNISSVPQYSRNYHALIAESIKSLNSNNPDNVYIIAKHFFAAGSLFSAQAYESNFQAAKLASKFHQFEDI